MSTNWQKVFNPNTEILWESWKTRLGDLVRSGWDIKVEEQDYNYSQVMYMRHPQHYITGISQPIEMDYHARSLMNGGMPLVIGMQFANNINIQHATPPVNLNSIQPDIRTQSIQMGMVIHNLEDLHIFDDPAEVPEEIIVEPETVSSLLAQIRGMQSDDAKRILKAQRIREGQAANEKFVNQQLNAKIISIVR